MRSLPVWGLNSLKLTFHGDADLESGSSCTTNSDRSEVELFYYSWFEDEWETIQTFPAAEPSSSCCYEQKKTWSQLWGNQGPSHTRVLCTAVAMLTCACVQHTVEKERKENGCITYEQHYMSTCEEDFTYRNHPRICTDVYRVEVQ